MRSSLCARWSHSDPHLHRRGIWLLGRQFAYDRAQWTYNYNVTVLQEQYFMWVVLGYLVAAFSQLAQCRCMVLAVLATLNTERGIAIHSHFMVFFIWCTHFYFNWDAHMHKEAELAFELGRRCCNTLQGRRYGTRPLSILAFLRWNKDPVIWNRLPCNKNHMIAWQNFLHRPRDHTKVTSKVVNFNRGTSCQSSKLWFDPIVLSLCVVATPNIQQFYGLFFARSASETTMVTDSEDSARTPRENHARMVRCLNIWLVLLKSHASLLVRCHSGSDRISIHATGNDSVAWLHDVQHTFPK